MKTGKFVMFFVSGLVFGFVSCSDLSGSVENLSELNNTEDKSAEVAALCGVCDFSGVLTETEVAGLMEMREEEKLAREVYLFLFQKYNHRIFSNIAKSEDAHTRAVLHLINGFGLADPTPVETREFNNPLFTEMYAQLTAKGTVSLVEALKVGALIEETDIADLQRHIAQTENATIARVYGNLLRGSKFHLKAFTSILKIMGESYSPTVLTDEEYQQILG
jgi:hypothetical protein